MRDEHGSWRTIDHSRMWINVVNCIHSLSFFVKNMEMRLIPVCYSLPIASWRWMWIKEWLPCTMLHRHSTIGHPWSPGVHSSSRTCPVSSSRTPPLPPVISSRIRARHRVLLSRTRPRHRVLLSRNRPGHRVLLSRTRPRHRVLLSRTRPRHHVPSSRTHPLQLGNLFRAHPPQLGNSSTNHPRQQDNLSRTRPMDSGQSSPRQLGKVSSSYIIILPQYPIRLILSTIPLQQHSMSLIPHRQPPSNSKDLHRQMWPPAVVYLPMAKRRRFISRRRRCIRRRRCRCQLPRRANFPPLTII